MVEIVWLVLFSLLHLVAGVAVKTNFVIPVSVQFLVLQPSQCKRDKPVYSRIVLLHVCLCVLAYMLILVSFPLGTMDLSVICSFALAYSLSPGRIHLFFLKVFM